MKTVNSQQFSDQVEENGLISERCRGAIRRALLTVLLLSLSAFLGGCQTAPVTGRQRVILTSHSQEMSLGARAWDELREQEQLSNNEKLTAAVKRVGYEIADAVNKPDFEWEFKLFAGDEANAFCLPGGKVGVYEGLFKYIENDAQLAAVMGHEIAHATARHGGERMTHAMGVGLAGLGLAVALESQDVENRELWLAAYSGITTVGVILPYSRVHEYEADRIGIIYMAKAGYRPEAAIEFWQSFAEGKGGAQIPEILSTHPLDRNRVDRLQKALPQAREVYEKAADKKGFGQRY